MKKKILSTLLMLIVSIGFAQTTYYVNGTTGRTTNNGTSWATAFTNLQLALDAATAGDQVWVAAGTYVPTEKPDGSLSGSTDRNNAFHFNVDIELYGGFVGIETAITQRPTSGSETILSGDLDADGDISYNAYHVMITSALTNAAIIDGFTITLGRATGSVNQTYNDYFSSGVGGGMNNMNSEPTLNNIIFSENYAILGGGISNTEASPTLTNVTFIDNETSQSGAGMINSSFSSPILTDVTFTGNKTSINGGAIYNDNSSPTLTDVVFTSNTASGQGGAMYNASSSDPIITNAVFSENKSSAAGGAIRNNASSPIFTNVLFTDNTSTGGFGGAMYSGSSSSTSLTNVTFSGNKLDTATKTGGAVYNEASSTLTINNTAFWNNKNGDGTIESIAGNTGTGDNNASDETTSTVPATTGALITLSTNPFTDSTTPAGADNIFGTSDDGLMPFATSVLVNAGYDSLNTETTDLVGNARKAGTIDIGAYEYGSSSLGINDVVINNNTLTIYPNPATSVLNIVAKATIKSVHIYTVSGVKVISTNKNTIDVSKLNSGIYLITVVDTEGNSSTIKFIKQ